MKSFHVVSVAVFCMFLPALAGCGRASAPAPAAPSAPEVKSPVLEEKKDDGTSLSSVETNLLVKLTIPPTERTATMKVEETTMPRNALAMCTVTLQPPPPASLVMSVFMESAQLVDFTASPMLLRGRVLREKDVIYSFSTLITNNSQLGVSPSANSLSFVVDGFLGLTTIPDTLLYHVELEMCFLPKDIDPATFNPDAPLPADTVFGHAMSNPLRLNIQKEQVQ